MIVDPGGCADISSMSGGVATAAASDVAEGARSEHWDSKIEAAEVLPARGLSGGGWFRSDAEGRANGRRPRLGPPIVPP